MNMNDTVNSYIIEKGIKIKTEYKVTYEHEKTVKVLRAEWKNGIKCEVTDDIYHGTTHLEEVYIKSEPVNTSEFKDELESAAVSNTGTRDEATVGVYRGNNSTNVIITEEIYIKSEPEDTIKCEEDKLNSAAITTIESLDPFWPYTTSSTDMSQYINNTSVRMDETDLKYESGDDCKYEEAVTGQDTECNTFSSSPDESCESRPIKFQQTKTSSNQCNICKKTFVQASYLVKHKRIHAGEKPFKCDQCNKAFSQSSNLFNHQRIHSGENVFKCEQCYKEFSRLSSLTRHEQLHSGEKLFKCEQCNKQFSRLSSLNRHKRLHSREKPFKCDQCNKAFLRLPDLIGHKRLHTGEKPFRCEQCNKAFSQVAHLITHKRVHSGEKPFKCDQCNKGFALANYLSGHKRTHMRGEQFKW